MWYVWHSCIPLNFPESSSYSVNIVHLIFFFCWWATSSSLYYVYMHWIYERSRKKWLFFIIFFFANIKMHLKNKFPKNQHRWSDPNLGFMKLVFQYLVFVKKPFFILTLSSIKYSPILIYLCAYNHIQKWDSKKLKKRTKK